MNSNDAEYLVKIINGKRTFEGKILLPSVMLWKCTSPGCTTPPKPQRRGKYKDKLLCNACSNRKKAQDPEFLKRRGNAISKSISELGDKWSETAKKNMASEEVRDKISESMKNYIQNNKEEAIAIRKETALKNNAKTGFGTSEFSKRIWENLQPEKRSQRIINSAQGQLETGREEHLQIMKDRYPDFSLLEFGHPDNLYECPKKHVFLMRGNNFLKRGNCPSCVEKSKIEVDMLEWSKTILPSPKHNKRVLFLDDSKNGNKALEIDIFDSEKNIGIEVHGLYYHQKDFVGDIHKTKAELADKWGYNLLQFFEDEILYREAIVKSMIKAKAGIFEKTIYARDTELVILNHKQSKRFLNDNHLQGDCKSFLKIGLKKENELISVVTFRKPRNKPGNTAEIARYCTKMGIQVIGGFAKMLKKAESLLKTAGYDTIGTYSDRRYSRGGVYKNNGFIFKHFTVPDMFWVKGTMRYPREFSWSKTEEEMKKYYQILGTGSSYWEKSI